MGSPNTTLTLPPPGPPPSLLSFGQKLAAPVPCLPFPQGLPGYHPRAPPHPLDVQRAQMLDLRLRYSLALQSTAAASGGLSAAGAMAGHLHHQDPMMAAYLYGNGMDPRVRFFQEEPKPSYSYIGLIAMGLLSCKDQKLILGDIYQWILDNYPYFRSRGPGWRNSIRHNLSLNDCFIKSGRAANGKGHYWAIHPACVDDFKKGDFRRRRAQRKVRRAMGLDVPDEEDSPSPPPSADGPLDWHARMIQDPAHRPRYPPPMPTVESPTKTIPSKRGFDVASLLAPDHNTSTPVTREAHGMDDSGVQSHGSDGEPGPDDDHHQANETATDDVWIDVDGQAEDDDDADDRFCTAPVKGVKRKLELDDARNESEPSRKMPADMNNHRIQDRVAAVAAPAESTTTDGSTTSQHDTGLDLSSTSSADLNRSSSTENDSIRGGPLSHLSPPSAVSSPWPTRAPPLCPPGWTPGRPSAFYPSPFLAWGGLPLSAIYPGGLASLPGVRAPLHPAQVKTTDVSSTSPDGVNRDIDADNIDGGKDGE